MSMGFPLDSYGLLTLLCMVFLWDCYGIPWDFHDISFGFPWCFSEVPWIMGCKEGAKYDFNANSMVFWWVPAGFLLDSCGISMVFLWNFHGVAMGFLKKFYGFLMGFLCRSYAISMYLSSFYEISLGFLVVFHDISMGLLWDFKWK